MTADRRPLPDDLNALKEIIGGRPADAQTMQRLITCNLVEELDGTALLTTSGIEAAALLAPTKQRDGSDLPALRCPCDRN
jgi:CDP-diacylglycerol pyrophosphatase